MNQLLTVTCDRDRWEFLLQCRSLSRYSVNNKLNIIVNELNPRPWLKWFDENCRLLLAEIEFKIYTYEDFYDDFILPIHKPGWHTQQIFKLVFALKTSGSYIVLDSKNWFVRPIDFNPLYKQKRWPMDGENCEHWLSFFPFYTACIEKLGLNSSFEFRTVLTPYHFDAGIILQMFEHFGGVIMFNKWFLSFEWPSEFIVYDLFLQTIDPLSDSGCLVVPYKNFFHNQHVTRLDIDQLTLAVADQNISMISIDRYFIWQDPDLKSIIEPLLPFNK